MIFMANQKERICDSCGQSLRVIANFCDICGKKLSDPIDVESDVKELAQNTLYCKYCGNLLPDGKLYCKCCGFKRN